MSFSSFLGNLLLQYKNDSMPGNVFSLPQCLFEASTA